MATYKDIKAKLNEMDTKGFLTDQIITYIGNKRALLLSIEKIVNIVKKDLGKKKLDCADLFSGSGIVARLLKHHSSNLYVNDLEGYAYTINKCYLTNKDSINLSKLKKWYDWLNKFLSKNENLKRGFISNLYCPKNDKKIRFGERVFFTSRNGRYIDSARKAINKIPEPYKTLLLAPLLYEASTKTNTSGVFKGFYKNSETNTGQFGGNGKNALDRILSNMKIKMPIFSEYNCAVKIIKGDANKIVKKLPHIDFAYLDPPYNQHPYGSNYFMLNLINEYKEPIEISKVSGIPKNWNKSKYNKKNKSLILLEKLIQNLKSKYVLVSFNSDGFITFNNMKKMLKKFGKVSIFETKYNVFRGCRNLRHRSIYVYEYLFLLKREL